MEILYRSVLVGVIIWFFAPTSVASDDVYRLGTGDSISFSVITFPELNRTIQIDVDGRVFLPLIGVFAAEGRSLDELRSEVELNLVTNPTSLPQRAAGEPLGKLSASDIIIDISEYRPVYVSGAVASPSVITFRPGMTVRQAIAQAGGIGLLSGELDETRLMEITAQRDELTSLIAARTERLVRLRQDLEKLMNESGSEASRVSAAEDPPPLSSLAGLSEVSEAWLQAREAQRAGERQLLSTTKKELVERMQVLDELMKISDETVALRESEYERLLDLRKRGISTENAVSQAQEGVLQASSRALDTSDEFLRIRSLIAETESQQSSTEAQSRVALLEAMDQELFELVRLRSRRASLDRNLHTAGFRSEEDADTRLIFRNFVNGRNPESVAVEPSDVLSPGDVIEVIIERATDTTGKSPGNL
ncbi:MAG: hypothetical protein HKN13_05535 [Rhodothermales bacterium]|nr:hypothetical protein [Rhodothermales bacterium]